LVGSLDDVAGAALRSARRRAEGPRDRLDVLLELLRAGPPAAIVDHVSELWMPATGTLGPFEVRSGDHTGD